MTFKDIFKSSFLSQTNLQTLSILDIGISLGLAFILGLFIYFIYKRSYKGVMFSNSFARSLVLLTMITTLVILAVTSNITLSLGMVGALSIVRFRSAVKEAIDIAFLFWSIAVGIILGAGIIPLAVVGSIIIGIIFVILSNINYEFNPPCILVLNANNISDKDFILDTIKKNTSRYKLKSQVFNNNSMEFIFEVLLKKDKDLIKELLSNKNISTCELVNYNGEYDS